MVTQNRVNIGSGNGLLPSHNLNQYWLVIKYVPWHSPVNSFTRSAHGHEINPQHVFGDFIFSCDQAALWMVRSVRLSVTPFSLCSHHRIIMKFSGVITYDKSDDHVKGQGQRSKIKVTEVKTQCRRCRTVTPVWIDIWWWNDTQTLMLLRRGVLLLFEVIRQISRSRG